MTGLNLFKNKMALSISERLMYAGLTFASFMKHQLFVRVVDIIYLQAHFLFLTLSMKSLFLFCYNM